MATELLFNSDSYQRNFSAEVVAITERGIELNQTLFYPEGGGQPGDHGSLRTKEGASIAIVDTQKGPDGAVIHVPDSASVGLSAGQQIEGEIDWDRRYRHMRMHTCLHLLCAVVDAPVTGGSISAERGRLDFDLPDPVAKEAITEQLNQLIVADHPLSSRWIDDAELDAQPELVKTLSVQPPRGSGKVRLMEITGVDLQPCGGTHVARTGEIGAVLVKKIEKKSRMNRRISVVFAP